MENNNRSSSGGISQFPATEKEEQGGVPAENSDDSAPSSIHCDAVPSLTSTSEPLLKKSRRTVQKRVVSVPTGDADGSRPKGAGEGAPPSDSWAWRKYGQKPIKGSPYPRGYYRCSSSKGCPARKQVERSREDPTMLVVTYAADHNHPWPLPRTTHHHHNHHSATVSPPKPDLDHDEEMPVQPGRKPKPAPDEHFAADLDCEEPSLMMPDPDGFCWLSDVSTSPPAAEAILDNPIFGNGGSGPDMAMLLSVMDGAGDEKSGEEDSLFAGLGELPECSVVFRRGYLERQMMHVQGEEGRRCRLTAASWCGSTG